MTLTAIALLAALGGPAAFRPGEPGHQSRADVRVLTLGGPGGDGVGGLDSDKDGTVSREEFVAPLARAFDRLDADHDGRLTTEERAAGRGPEGAGGPGAHVIMMHGPGGAGRSPMTFHLGDEARVLSFREGGPAGGAPSGHGDRRIEIRRFGGPGGADRMDTNRDGEVSEEEFLAPMREAFRSMDADGDGALGAAEGSDGPPPPPAPPAG